MKTLILKELAGVKYGLQASGEEYKHHVAVSVAPEGDVGSTIYLTPLKVCKLRDWLTAWLKTQRGAK